MKRVEQYRVPQKDHDLNSYSSGVCITSQTAEPKENPPPAGPLALHTHDHLGFRVLGVGVIFAI